MIKTILLYTGAIAWGLVFAFLIYHLLKSELIRLPFRRPWQFIKHILPWFWIDEGHWREFQQGIDIAMSNSRETEWKRHVELKRYGQLGILIDNLREHWWQPKYHLFIVKKG